MVVIADSFVGVPKNDAPGRFHSCFDGSHLDISGIQISVSTFNCLIPQCKLASVDVSVNYAAGYHEMLGDHCTPPRQAKYYIESFFAIQTTQGT